MKINKFLIIDNKEENTYTGQKRYSVWSESDRFRISSANTEIEALIKALEYKNAKLILLQSKYDKVIKALLPLLELEECQEYIQDNYNEE